MGNLVEIGMITSGALAGMAGLVYGVSRVQQYRQVQAAAEDAEAETVSMALRELRLGTGQGEEVISFAHANPDEASPGDPAQALQALPRFTPSPDPDPVAVPWPAPPAARMTIRAGTPWRKPPAPAGAPVSPQADDFIERMKAETDKHIEHLAEVTRDTMQASSEVSIALRGKVEQLQRTVEEQVAWLQEETDGMPGLPGR